MIRRREFIAGLGGAATWPLAVRAQQPALPMIGLLSSTPFETYNDEFAAFRRGLAETGHVEGQNVAFEYRTAENHFDRLPALADDLVRRRVAAIFTAANLSAALAAKAASRVTPIVFMTGADPRLERHGRKPLAARREHHRRDHPRRGAYWQTMGVAARVGAGSRDRGLSL
jgi:putative tryptophan/tyrosine transport system substrate-binding protein